MTQNTLSRRSLRLPIALAMLVASVVAAGATTYSARRTSRVEAFDTDVWTVWAGRSARVEVEGDGDTDLDCYVYDLRGQLLGYDDDRTDFCIVDLDRAVSGNVKVHIKNLGTVYNRYELRVE